MIESTRRERVGRLWREMGILLFLFLSAWIPRILALNAFVTVDERKWLNRSANFYVALTNLDWASTFQKEHPGVTVQWLGLLGLLSRFPGYPQWAGTAITDDVLEQRLWESGPLTPLELLTAGRWWVTLVIALAIAAMYRPLKRLFGPVPAAAAVLFVAWSPYYVALSRQLHPDGLLASLSVLALVLWLVWLYDGRQYRDLLGSGIIFGLALLTKTTAAFVGITGGLLVLFELVQSRHASSRNRLGLVGSALLWIVVAAMTFVLLWPAMWVNPLTVLLRISVQMQQYQAEAHSLPTFFLGRVFHDDPGWLFYPFVILWRMSPVTMIGLPLTLWVVWTERAPLNDTMSRRAAAGLLLFALLTVAGMGTGAKKIDRYVLPACLSLDMLAALGWVGFIRVLFARPSSAGRRTWVTAAALSTVILLHGLFTVRHYPYYLTYFNPFLGGTDRAPNVIMVGWGEGLDQVGAWLTDRIQPGNDTEPLSVVSWYDDGPLSYFLPGNVRHTDFIESDNYWFDADYAVLYVNQWQRQNPDPEMIAHFLAQEPVFAVNANGLELAKVYDLRASAPPPFTDLYVESAANLDEAIALDAYRLKSTSLFPGESIPITLFMHADAPITRDLDVRLSLRDAAGNVIWNETRHPAGIRTRDWTPGTIYEDPYRIDVPPDTQPGTMSIWLTLFGDRDDSAQPPIEHRVTQVTVQVPDAIALDVRWEKARLYEIQHAPQVAPDRALVVDLRGESDPDSGTKLSLRLVDDAGKTWAQVDKVFEPNMRFELELPSDATAGSYTVSAVAYDTETLVPFSDGADQSPTVLSTITVAEQ